MFSGKADDGHQDTIIENDGFWPNLNAGDFEKRRGVPMDMDKESIAYSVAAAIAQINIELAYVKTSYQAEGIAKAIEVSGQPKIGNKNLLVILYEKAVFARTKSELLPEFATIQMRDAGENVANSQVETSDRLLAESQQHIRAIKGKGRTGIALL